MGQNKVAVKRARCGVTCMSTTALNSSKDVSLTISAEDLLE
jgi:hypothetical protein